MENSKKSQLIGLELEIYSRLTPSRLSEKIRRMGIHGFEVVTDASLYDYGDYHGAEIRCNAPFRIPEIENKLRDVHRIVTDEEIDAQHNDDDNIRGTTGFHIHFGLSHSRTYNFLDFLRLLRGVYSEESHIEELAMRPCNRWARSMGDVVNEIDNAIASLPRNRENSPRSIQEKIAYLSRSSGTTSLIDAVFHYNITYSDFKRKARQITRAYKTMFSNSALNGAVQRYEHDGMDIKLKCYTSREEDMYKFEFSLCDEGDCGFYVSELYPHLVGLKQFGSARENSKLLLNKYIREHEAIDTVFRYIADHLGISQNDFGFCRNYDMKLIRMYYNMFNGHESRAINTAIENESFCEYINSKYRLSYRPASNQILHLDWFSDMLGYHYDDNRYYGVNATNIGEKYRDGRPKLNTIEFRWASSRLTTNLAATLTYFWKLADIYFESMSSKDTMEWNGHILKDITDVSKRIDSSGNSDSHSLSVIKDNRLLGRIHCPTLSHIVKNPYRSSILDIMNTGFDNQQKKEMLISHIRHKKNVLESVKNKFSSLSEDKKIEAISNLRAKNFDFVA